MVEKTELCHFHTSWHTEECVQFSSCVVYRKDQDEDESCSPLPQSCLYLRPPEHECGESKPPQDTTYPPCTIDIRSESRMTIAAIDILCSARHMEIFSHRGEYLATDFGISLSALDDDVKLPDKDSEQEPEKLYLLQHSFDDPLPNCQIKIVSLKQRDRLCIHSVHITLSLSAASQTHNPLAGMTPHIDVNKVKVMMKEMNQEIPDKAKGLMTAMEATQRNKEMMMGSLGSMMAALSGRPAGGSQQGPPDMASMMAALSGRPAGGSQQGPPDMASMMAALSGRPAGGSQQGPPDMASMMAALSGRPAGGSQQGPPDMASMMAALSGRPAGGSQQGPPDMASMMAALSGRPAGGSQQGPPDMAFMMEALSGRTAGGSQQGTPASSKLTERTESTPISSSTEMNDIMSATKSEHQGVNRGHSPPMGDLVSMFAMMGAKNQENSAPPFRTESLTEKPQASLSCSSTNLGDIEELVTRLMQESEQRILSAVALQLKESENRIFEMIENIRTEIKSPDTKSSITQKHDIDLD